MKPYLSTTLPIYLVYNDKKENDRKPRLGKAMKGKGGQKPSINSMIDFNQTPGTERTLTSGSRCFGWLDAARRAEFLLDDFVLCQRIRSAVMAGYICMKMYV